MVSSFAFKKKFQTCEPGGPRPYISNQFVASIDICSRYVDYSPMVHLAKERKPFRGSIGINHHNGVKRILATLPRDAHWGISTLNRSQLSPKDYGAVRRVSDLKYSVRSFFLDRQDGGRSCLDLCSSLFMHAEEFQRSNST